MALTRKVFFLISLCFVVASIKCQTDSLGYQELQEELHPKSNVYIPYLGKNNKYGYVNYSSKELKIPCVYDTVGLFNGNSKAYVVKNNSPGYIDTLNNFISTEQKLVPQYQQEPSDMVVLPFEFAETADGADSLQTMVKMGNKYAYYNWEGKRLTEPIYEGYLNDCDYDVMILRKGNKYGVLDADGVQCTEFIYDSITCDGIIKKDNKYGVLKFRGDKMKPVKLDILYDSIVYRGMFYHTERNNKWGLYSDFGQLLVENNYDYILVSDANISRSTVVAYSIYPLTIIKKDNNYGSIKLPLPVYNMFGNLDKYLSIEENYKVETKRVQNESKRDIPAIYDSMDEFEFVDSVSFPLI